MPTDAHAKYFEQSDGYAFSPAVTQFVSVLPVPELLEDEVGEDVVNTTAGVAPVLLLLAPLVIVLHTDDDEIRPTAALNAFSSGHLHELQTPS